MSIIDKVYMPEYHLKRGGSNIMNSSQSTLIMEKPFKKVIDSFWTVLTAKVN